MSVHSSIKLSALSLFAASVVTLASLALSGCAVDNIASNSATSGAVAAIEGKAMGGATPIYGANVILWETDPANTGYPTSVAPGFVPASPIEKAKILAGSLSGAVTTTSTGGFSFLSNAYTCDTGTFLYITVTGGSLNGTAPGSSGALVNNNLVLMSALGSCANFPAKVANSSSTIHIAVNEATTVAAAYALGNFIYVDNTTPGLQGVYIGAPANNNATTGSCTGAGSAMTCKSAGLAHAFANALNLVNSVNFNGTVPTGYPYTVTPNNAQGSIPVADVLMLSNILAACTNSAGGSGTTGAAGTSDGSTCGNFFADSKSVSCSATTCVPVDELTATMSMAKNPEHNIGILFAIVGTGSGAPFTPSLTSAPQNLSITITYAGDGSTAFGAPQALTLDANDDVYVLSSDGATTITKSGIVALSSVGTKLWNSGQSTSYVVPKFIATDTVGNVWVTDEDTSAASITALSQTSGTINQSFTTTSTPAISQQPQGLAIDQYNNVWYDQGSSANAALYEIPYSGGANSGGTYSTQVAYATGLSMLNEILFDQSQNIWFSTFGGASSSTPAILYVLPNQNAATLSSAPSYVTSGTTTPVSTFSYSAASPYYTWGLSIDGSSNVWAEQNKAFEELKLTKTSSVITSAPTANVTTATLETKPYQTQFDSQGQVFYAYYSTSGEIYYVYNPTAGSSASNKGIVPCYAPSSATTCSTTAVIASPTALQIDSTGAIWASGQGTSAAAPGNGNLVQILGAAYPVWPQLSYTHYGQAPQ